MPADPRGPLSRRGLLRKVGGAAAAGASLLAGSALASSPAVAAPGDAVLQGRVNDAGAARTSVNSASSGITVLAQNTLPGVGVLGDSAAGSVNAFYGAGAGVLGLRGQNFASGLEAGVRGESASRAGVQGAAFAPATGVTGRSLDSGGRNREKPG